MLSVLSYNIHYGKKLSKITNWLITHSIEFDVICLQEFPIAQIKAFVDEIKHTTFDYRYSHSFTKKGVQFGQLTLINTQKIKILNHDIVNLGTSLIEGKFSKNRGERSVLITLLEHNKKQFVVANMHLVCFAMNKLRLVQLKKVLGSINTSPKPEIPTVMLGDFNYSSLIRQKKLFRFMQTHDFLNAYKLRTNRLLFIPQQLDYVFYRNCTVTNTHMTRLRFSDHYPIQFSLKI